MGKNTWHSREDYSWAKRRDCQKLLKKEMRELEDEESEDFVQ